MDKNEIEVGEQYKCRTSLLDELFIGTALIKNENTCIVEVADCGENEVKKALEFNNRFVVRFSDITK